MCIRGSRPCHIWTCQQFITCLAVCMLRCCVQVALLVESIPTLIATPLGGHVSDRFATRGAGVSSTSRLVPNTLALLVLGPVGAFGAGWALQFRIHASVPLICVAAASFGGYFYVPAIFSYGTTVKQSASASVTAGIQTTVTIAAAGLVMVTAAVRGPLGYGWWFTILSGIHLLLGVVAYAAIVREQRAFAQNDLLPPRVDTNAGEPGSP